jgi:hypothetical protein
MRVDTMNNAGNSSPLTLHQSKTAGSKAGAAQVQAKATHLRTLSYRRLNINRIDQVDNKFFKVAFQKQPVSKTFWLVQII